MYGDPKDPPVYVNSDDLIDGIKEYCNLQKEKEILDVGKRTFEPEGFDREKLDSAIEFLEMNLPNNCYEEWYRIGFGLVTTGEEGRKYFLKMSLGNQHYRDSEFEINRKFDSLQKKYNGKVTFGTVYHLTEKYG